MHDKEYKSNIKALAQDMSWWWTLDEGVMAAKAIRTREEPEFHNLVKPGGDATRKTVLKYEFDVRMLAKDKSGWKVARSAVFDKFMSHCGPRMRVKLSAEDG